MTTMNESLRPSSLGEILDRIAQLYRSNFLLFAGVAAVPTGVLIAVFAIAGAMLAIVGVSARGAMSPALLTGALVVVIVLVGLPVGLAATVFSHAGLTRTAVCAHMGERLTIRAAFKSVRPRFWRYLGLMMLQGLFAVGIPTAAAGVLIAALGFLASLAGSGSAGSIFAGFLVFCVFTVAAVAVIMLALACSMAMAVCVVEDKPAWESLNRALKLSKGTRGRIFLMFLLVWALSFVLSMMAYIPTLIIATAVTAIGHGAEYATLTLIVAEILNFLINFAIQTLITPVYTTGLVLFYYDQRIRKEGFDIEWMMTQAGLTGEKTSTGPEQAGILAEGLAGPDTVKEL
jgi:hypothetical protein